MKILVFIVALGLLIITLLTDDLNFFASQNLEAHGSLIHVEGRVMGRSPQDEFFKDLRPNDPLSSPHQVITGFNSQSLIHFGERFQLLENSSIRLVKLPTLYQVHLLSGEISRPKPNENVEFLIDNKVIEGDRIKIEQQTQVTNLMSEEIKIQPSRPSGLQDKKLQDLLHDTFKLHQRFIEKCFIKHYERVEGKTKSGQILVRFQIEERGQLRKVGIQESQFEDESFHDCIKEVVSRVRLKFYEGEIKTVDFPIQVTLPL